MLKKIAYSLVLLIVSTTSWANESTTHTANTHVNTDLHAHANNKHAFGVFIGGLRTDKRTYASYGLEYAYEFNHQWATSFVWETVDGAHDGDRIETYVISALYSPVDKVWLGLGYGKEKIHNENSGRENVYRVSVNYDFFVENIKIAPMIAVDFVDGEQLAIFGASFGVTF
ncbi:hypothetical protein LP316_05005 [Thalassotalea sp. LPB0316]|uniref:hypothetical protein n=1 Tax=Thalassotalea sp. LPB0316 TaxID=2769490 RepID=UPI001867C869|nr:hypothetical protein [Thalassotalea sp. LPB0316]QOL26662.1 hypothetical protein LP316_05005 [Thalassotalea sp. LPB0316]